MALYTKSQLRLIAESETITETRNFSNRTGLDLTSYDIFLCHSYLDKALVRGLYLDLQRKGHTVYVDWIVDPDLDRANVTKEVAERIRRRLGSSRSLLLAFSINTGLSKWVPWELGVVDGAGKHCGIVPVAETTTVSYERAEYLQLYPVLENYVPAGTGAKLLLLSENANRYVGLGDWLKGNKPTYQASSIH